MMSPQGLHFRQQNQHKHQLLRMCQGGSGSATTSEAVLSSQGVQDPKRALLAALWASL
jgi:hypothetical protein